MRYSILDVLVFYGPYNVDEREGKINNHQPEGEDRRLLIRKANGLTNRVGERSRRLKRGFGGKFLVYFENDAPLFSLLFASVPTNILNIRRNTIDV